MYFKNCFFFLFTTIFFELFIQSSAPVVLNMKSRAHSPRKNRDSNSSKPLALQDHPVPDSDDFFDLPPSPDSSDDYDGSSGSNSEDDGTHSPPDNTLEPSHEHLQCLNYPDRKFIYGSPYNKVVESHVNMIRVHEHNTVWCDVGYEGPNGFDQCNPWITSAFIDINDKTIEKDCDNLAQRYKVYLLDEKIVWCEGN